MICYTYVTGKLVDRDDETAPQATAYVQVIPARDGSGMVRIFAGKHEDGTDLVIDLDEDHARALAIILAGSVGDLSQDAELERLLSV